MLSLSKAIGGYFELELPREQGFYYPDALKYQSARAAFYDLLLYVKPQKVWMPYYICDSMLAPLKKLDIEICFYSINIDFSIRNDLKLNENELLLYVNYYGICKNQQKDILNKYNPQQVVFDHSQAFFNPPEDCLATIYSPRKFFGVPDGGLLVTSLDITEPEEVDIDSLARASHLIQRLAGEPENGYAAYQKNEETLNDFQPKKMSVLTERLLNSVNYEFVKNIRNENFASLHNKIGESNELKINQNNINGPMGYPYLTKNLELRSRLIGSRIFIPTYWPEVLDRQGVADIERWLVKNFNLIPCDQRYKNKDMIRIAEYINEY